jgi:uncharacterized protein YjgD (DUF1641 family)
LTLLIINIIIFVATHKNKETKMNPDVNRKVLDICKSMCSQMTAFGKLNNEALDSLASSSSLEEFLNAQKPEDFMNAQFKLALEANARAMNYMQKSYSIMLEAQQEILKQFTNFTTEFAKQPIMGVYSKAVKTAAEAATPPKK